MAVLLLLSTARPWQATVPLGLALIAHLAA